MHATILTFSLQGLWPTSTGFRGPAFSLSSPPQEGTSSCERHRSFQQYRRKLEAFPTRLETLVCRLKFAPQKTRTHENLPQSSGMVIIFADFEDSLRMGKECRSLKLVRGLARHDLTRTCTHVTGFKKILSESLCKCGWITNPEPLHAHTPEPLNPQPQTLPQPPKKNPKPSS